MSPTHIGSSVDLAALHACLPPGSSTLGKDYCMVPLGGSRSSGGGSSSSSSRMPSPRFPAGPAHPVHLSSMVVYSYGSVAFFGPDPSAGDWGHLTQLVMPHVEGRARVRGAVADVIFHVVMWRIGQGGGCSESLGWMWQGRYVPQREGGCSKEGMYRSGRVAVAGEVCTAAGGWL